MSPRPFHGTPPSPPTGPTTILALRAPPIPHSHAPWTPSPPHLQAIPKVVEVMGNALGWSNRERKRQTAMAEDYIGQFGGPIADKKDAKLKARTYTDLMDIFTAIDRDGAPSLDLT